MSIPAVGLQRPVSSRSAPTTARCSFTNLAPPRARRRVRLHEMNGGRLVWAVDFPEGEYPVEARFVSDGQRLLVQVSSAKGERVMVLDARDGRKTSTRRLPEKAREMRFGAQTMVLSGSRLVGVGNAHAVVYELDRPAEDEDEDAASMSFVHDSNIAGVALVPNNSRLVTLDQVGVIREWDLAPRPRPKRSFIQFGDDGSRLCINVDGSRRLYYPQYINDKVKSVPRIVDASEREVGDRLASFPPGQGHAHGPAPSADGNTQAIAWHPDKGECLAVAWDLATGRERCRIPLGPGIWEAIAVSPDGSRAVVLGSPAEMAGKPRIPRFARIVDLNAGNVVWSSEGQAGSPLLSGCRLRSRRTARGRLPWKQHDERRLGHRLVRCHDHGRSGSFPGRIARRHRRGLFSRRTFRRDPGAAEAWVRLARRDCPSLSRGPYPSRRVAGAALSAHGIFRPV